ncbi:MAG: LLM class flavin-dependent oxidoreductase [Thaumarchaeota archaeon]|nr:LLM class flavin-dependent oxidoreductase [Nitrososphaerota archaeon]
MRDSRVRVRFGLTEISVEPQQAIEEGVLAEKAGFDSVWIPDHIVDVNGDKLEPWTVLSAVAVRTKKVKLGSAVADTQRVHPSRTAHIATTLNHISRGRVLLGIGAGEAMNVVPYGLPWEEPAGRAARLEEAIRVIKLLWSSTREEMVSFSGDYYTLDKAFISLRQYGSSPPPVYVGAMNAKTTLEISGRLGEGWFSWFNTPETFVRKWKVVSEAAKAAGRDPRRIDTCSHLMIALPRNSEERSSAMLGAKATLLMEKRTLASMGYEARADFLQYQNFTITKEYVAQIMKAASEIPDEFVHRCMAIGTLEEVKGLVDQFSKAGIRHMIVADFLAPKTTKRTIQSLKKLIASYH